LRELELVLLLVTAGAGEQLLLALLELDLRRRLG
jgi:hypothetical protein